MEEDAGGFGSNLGFFTLRQTSTVDRGPDSGEPGLLALVTDAPGRRGSRISEQVTSPPGQRTPFPNHVMVGMAALIWDGKDSLKEKAGFIEAEQSTLEMRMY
jgi:hypothetical protein